MEILVLVLERQKQHNTNKTTQDKLMEILVLVLERQKDVAGLN